MQKPEKTDDGKLSFAATLKAVFWSFFGVRKKSSYERDAANLNPVYLIIAALLGVAIFISVLIALVKFAVAT
jgi:hypothetical protein